jgi:hypothetical protein
VTHRASAKFWRFYDKLPVEIQRLADKNFALLKRDLSHRSLHFKKTGRFWSARVGVHYRTVAVQQGDNLVWFWIGTHEDYNRLRF